VPAGVFRLGADEAEPDEAPSHLIRLDACFIDETEVTNRAYRACVDDGACAAPDRPGATYHASYYGDPAFDDYPVIFVSWFDARDFCDWRDARLPTEAEWEKAAGFDPLEALKYAYPWGDEFDGTLLNFCDVSCGDQDRNVAFSDEHRDTAPADAFPAGRSPVGLYNMAGNVMEWIADWYDARAYRTSADTNPLGPMSGEFKVIRGGSWLSSQEDVRTSSRTSFDPQVSRANLGFRCAMTAP
jgi:formylglycine-generating enzyme required for sulfatase activity